MYEYCYYYLAKAVSVYNGEVEEGERLAVKSFKFNRNVYRYFFISYSEIVRVSSFFYIIIIQNISERSEK